MGLSWRLVTYSITIPFVIVLLSPRGSEGYLESVLRSEFGERKQSAFTKFGYQKEPPHYDSKNPSYLHKMLQLYGNDGTRNSPKPNQKQHLVEHPATPIPLTDYLVAGKLQKFHPVEPIGSVIFQIGHSAAGMELHGNWIPLKTGADPEPGGINYTPYVAIHSFTDLMKFLHHLTDNLKSVKGDELSSELAKKKLAIKKLVIVKKSIAEFSPIGRYLK